MLRIAWFVIAVAIVLDAALYNGYPLVYADSGTYIDSSFGLKVPLDRPAFYGVFLALTHWKLTLWASIVAQSAVAVAMIRLILEQYAPTRNDWLIVPTCLLLSIGTALPWVQGQLMPDCFTGLLALALFTLLFLRERLTSVQHTFVCGTLVLSLLVHNSHPPLALVLIGATAAGQWFWPSAPISPGAVRKVLLLWVATVILALGFNLARTGEIFLARVPHIFVMGRLVGDGIIQRLLNEHCLDQRYALCPNASELKEDAVHYVWDPASPLHKIGGFEGSRVESWRMIYDSLRFYPLLHIKAAIESGLSQLVLVRTGDGMSPYLAGTWVDTVVQKRFSGEYRRFATARQQRGELADLGGVALVHTLALALSLGVLVIVGWVDRSSARNGAWLAIFVIAAVVANAGVVGALTGPLDRYQTRIVWLLSFAAIVCASSTAQKRTSTLKV